MKKLIYSTQFKKDFKCYRKNAQKMELLLKVLQMLAKGCPIPSEMRPHALKGDYQGCIECHIGNDFLLIWMDESNSIIRLLRLGSHSELF